MQKRSKITGKCSLLCWKLENIYYTYIQQQKHFLENLIVSWRTPRNWIVLWGMHTRMKLNREVQFFQRSKKFASYNHRRDIYSNKRTEIRFNKTYVPFSNQPGEIEERSTCRRFHRQWRLSNRVNSFSSIIYKPCLWFDYKQTEN